MALTWRLPQGETGRRIETISAPTAAGLETRVTARLAQLAAATPQLRVVDLAMSAADGLFHATLTFALPQDAPNFPGGGPGGGPPEALFVDAVAGNDSNDGTTALTALKTWAEAQRRLESGTIAVTTAVTLLTDIPEVLTGNFELAPGVVLVIAGTTSVIRSGTLTAATSINQATGTAQSITDALVADWTPEVGRFVQLTSGAATGAWGVVAKDQAAGAARASRFGIYNIFAAPLPQSLSLQTPAGTETYDVLDTTSVLGVDLKINRPNDGAGGEFVCCLLIDLEVVATPGIQCAVRVENTPGFVTELVRCRFPSASTIFSASAGAFPTLLGCSVGASAVYGHASFSGGAHFGILQVQNARAFLTQNPLFQGAQVNVREKGTLVHNTSQGAQSFDSPSDGVSVIATGDIRGASTGIWFGSGNTTAGMRFESGSKMAYRTQPSITGSTPGVNDVILGVTTILGWAGVPAGSAITARWVAVVDGVP